MLDEGDDSEEDVEDDLQLNVFLAGCTGLSRNSLEKAISLVSRTPVRIHRMRSSDHRRARLHTPQCVQKLLNLEILTVRQQEVRVIEWDPITADMEPMEAQHQPRARMVDVAVRTTVTAEAMRTVIGHIRHAILDLDRSVDALEQVWIEPADVGIVPISRMRRGRWRMIEAEKGNTDSSASSPRTGDIYGRGLPASPQKSSRPTTPGTATASVSTLTTPDSAELQLASASSPDGGGGGIIGGGLHGVSPAKMLDFSPGVGSDAGGGSGGHDEGVIAAIALEETAPAD